MFLFVLGLISVVEGLIVTNNGRLSTRLHAATLEKPSSDTIGRTSANKEAVDLGPCPLTEWGQPFDVVAEQAKVRKSPKLPFTWELKAPTEAQDSKSQLEWLGKNADAIKEKMYTHGAVIFRGWELIKNPEGFRAAYEALGMLPCLDPLHAVSARPMVDKKSAVYEAVNKESRANFFIGMHNEFVGTRSPRAAMFVCFKAADEGGEFLLADGRSIFRDVDTHVLKRLYEKKIRYSVMELPFFSFIDTLPEFSRQPLSQIVRAIVEAAVNAKVDFDVALRWLEDSKYDDDAKTLQARAPAQPPVVKHPITGQPTWFCNVHSHSSRLRKQRELQYGTEIFEDGASRINKSDMYYGDDDVISDQDFDHLDQITNNNIKYVAMKPGDAVLLDNYQTMHGRNVFKGQRKHAVTWFA
mmetsp:Transcript_9451/g.14540  ORF Transcript_9451/g.14540 Transcript_9451/m.14540 type:complete len:411 (+) Transcript_9451:39-1271(+)